MLPLACVITTIQPPTPAVRALGERLTPFGAPMYIVGDRKGPFDYALPGCRFLSLTDQLNGPFDLARALPVGHYTRKNVGYLAAIAAGAECIYETDDDNAPMPGWTTRGRRTPAVSTSDSGWVNVYRCFSGLRIWPRGLPLDALTASFAQPVALETAPTSCYAPIQQGLANGSPDVDAIWRLVFDLDVRFDDRSSVALPAGAYCPFNSQSTWWWPEAYPLLYLPSHCSFRMTDIWRSFIAQRCVWELGAKLVFHAAEVVQDRNVHNLMRDFQDEIPGYERNRELMSLLIELPLAQGVSAVADNLLRCYEHLVMKGIFPEAELGLVRQWLHDLESLPSQGWNWP